MSIQCDCHMHSYYSQDSEAPMETMIQSAMQKGLKIICFTEHIDLDFPCEKGAYMVDMDSYITELHSLRERYRSLIDLRLGIELGMQPHLAARYAQIAKQYPFDFIVSSQHLVGDEDPYYPSYWIGKEETPVYQRYFELLLANLKAMKDYDTVAHLDYIVRYGPNQNQDYSWQKYGEYIEPILDYIISQGKCLEVNTAGLKYGLGHPNPDEFVLRRYHELGGERITIGSDAHKPEHIAYGFAKAEAILKQLGFRAYTVFRNRIPEEIAFAG